VNLIGEHTDYNEGFVLPVGIDRQALFVADRTDTSHSVLYAVDLDETVEADLTQPLSPLGVTHWANYPLGVAQQFVGRGFDLPPIEALFTSSVPIGAGLSSSAAIEVAMATLLEQLLGVELEPLEKVLLCQKAENVFAGAPCGIMDMYTATMAEPDHALLLDCRCNRATPIRMPSADEAALLIADTGVKHELATSAYAERRATCERAAAALGVSSLRDATIEMLDEGQLTKMEHSRAYHVIGENRRVELAATALREGNLERFGDLMFESHASLRELFEVSCPELDTLVDTARGLRDQGLGVLGARMTGAGFGGCAIILCRAPAAGIVADGLAREYEARHSRPPKLFEARAASGARAIPLTR
jgi:galactokinase